MKMMKLLPCLLASLIAGFATGCATGTVERGSRKIAGDPGNPKDGFQLVKLLNHLDSNNNYYTPTSFYTNVDHTIVLTAVCRGGYVRDRKLVININFDSGTEYDTGQKYVEFSKPEGSRAECEADLNAFKMATPDHPVAISFHGGNLFETK